MRITSAYRRGRSLGGSWKRLAPYSGSKCDCYRMNTRKLICAHRLPNIGGSNSTCAIELSTQWKTTYFVLRSTVTHCLLLLPIRHWSIPLLGWQVCRTWAAWKSVAGPSACTDSIRPRAAWCARFPVVRSSVAVSRCRWPYETVQKIARDATWTAAAVRLLLVHTRGKNRVFLFELDAVAIAGKDVSRRQRWSQLYEWMT